FRAPDLGTRRAVPTERVVEAIRPHQLIGIDTRGISEVVVTRASRAVTAQETAAAIAKALETQYGLGEARNISVEFDRDARTLNVEPNISGELQVMSLTYNRRTSISTQRSTCRRARPCTGKRPTTRAVRSRQSTPSLWIIRSSMASFSRPPI